MWSGDGEQASPPEGKPSRPPLRHKDGGQALQRRVNPGSIDNRPENFIWAIKVSKIMNDT